MSEHWFVVGDRVRRTERGDWSGRYRGQVAEVVATTNTSITVEWVQLPEPDAKTTYDRNDLIADLYQLFELVERCKPNDWESDIELE